MKIHLMTQKDSYFITVCHYLTYLLDYMKNIEEYKEEKKTTRIMWFNFTAYVHIEKPPLMAISLQPIEFVESIM